MLWGKVLRNLPDLKQFLTFINLRVTRRFNKIFVESTLNRLYIDVFIDAGRDSSSTYYSKVYR